jgi:hypothetical protein
MCVPGTDLLREMVGWVETSGREISAGVPHGDLECRHTIREQ